MEASNRMMVILLFCALAVYAKAQSPARINYQAIARSSTTGEVLVNQDVFVSFKIRAESPSGNILYQEEHSSVLTNTYGLFNLQIGGGSPMIGNMETINWASGNFWLEIDLDAGSGLETIGAMQLLSVPFAFHANTVSNTDDADPDPENELIDTFLFDDQTGVISVTDAGGTKTISLANALEDADTDPENELVSNFIFDASNSSLTLSEANNDLQVNLEALIDDADADPTNEKISGIFYNAASNSLTVAEGGQNYSTGLGPIDNDLNPSNELIDSNGLVLSDDGVLTISEAGILHNVDLTGLFENYWTKSLITNAVYNIPDRIGIGASNPSARLEVRAPISPAEPALRVYSSPGEPALEVNENVVSTGSTAVLRVNGQFQFGVKIISGFTSSYTVEDEDVVIVVKRTPLNANSVTIQLPDAESFEGRLITIKSVGPTLALQSVIVSASGQQIDFSTNQVTLNALSNGILTLVSIGADGWAKL